MSRLSPDLEEALQARIRYYRDLGVYDFYRRCEPDAAALPDALNASSTVAANTASAQGFSHVDAEPSSSVSPALPSVFTYATESAIPTRKPIAPPPSKIFETVPAAHRPAALEAIRADIGDDCTRCPLGTQGRHKIVFADGDPNARLMFVGEGPGADEDAQGLPFVGRAGQLLNNMINAMGVKREQVYIANVVKCRPPQNRTPEPDEANTCMQFLWKQIDVVRPEVMVLLG